MAMPQFNSNFSSVGLLLADTPAHIGCAIISRLCLSEERPLVHLNCSLPSLSIHILDLTNFVPRTRLFTRTQTRISHQYTTDPTLYVAIPLTSKGVQNAPSYSTSSSRIFSPDLSIWIYIKGEVKQRPSESSLSLNLCFVYPSELIEP